MPLPPNLQYTSFLLKFGMLAFSKGRVSRRFSAVKRIPIGSSGVSPHDADFVPPHHERLRPALVDLGRFARRNDLPALAHGLSCMLSVKPSTRSWTEMVEPAVSFSSRCFGVAV